MHWDQLRAGPCLCEETGSPLPLRVLPSLVFSSPLPDFLIVAGCLCVWGSCMRGAKKAQSPQKKLKTPEQAKQRLPPPRYSPSCLKTSCMLNSRLPFWAGQTRQRCAAPGPGPPPTPLAQPGRAPGAGGGCRSRAPPPPPRGCTAPRTAPRTAPARCGSRRRRGLQRRERPGFRAGGGKGARGKGAGAVPGPSLSCRPRRLRFGQKVAGGMVRGGGCPRCGVNAPGDWIGREPCAKGFPPAQGPRTGGPVTLGPWWPRWAECLKSLSCARRVGRLSGTTEE